MGILKSIAVRNFKCFRSETTVQLAQGTYLVGPNDSGKTALLTALQCFFDSDAFSPEHLNKTELAAKKGSFNRSDITVTFDLEVITGKVRKKRLVEEYGNSVAVTKSFTWREKSATIQVDYGLGGKTCTFDDLPPDIQTLLQSIAISYIHPQEGAVLLRKAQDKFKQRLFHNWGRHASVAEKLRSIQEQWVQLRGTANQYLSSTLTARLREIWPGSQTKVDLPARIEDIVAISDITFRGSPSLPEVTLTSHGTGAQSTILYQTHYILDSDRTLHPGLYFPVWLLEEPESFLHADIAFQLARLLGSDQWLSSIQMVISTHSPIILAASRQSSARTRWVVLENQTVARHVSVADVSEVDVQQLGRMMGDSNFDVYFSAARRGPLVFLEDSRSLTRASFERAGITVTDTLGGVTQVKKYLSVLPHLSASLHDNAYVVTDSDAGARELAQEIQKSRETANQSGWRKLRVAERVFLILLPQGSATEDLFPEWPDVLDEVFDELYDAPNQLKDKIPATLSRAVGVLRAKAPATRDEAVKVLRTQQDVKDRFWDRVGRDQLQIAPANVAALKALLALS